MRLGEMRNAGRQPTLPLRLELADGAGPAELRLDSLLRVLPGRRYVGAGDWRGRQVLAKLLVGGKAARHFQRELAGVRLLAEQCLTTPLLLADGLREGEGGWLLFEFLDDAHSLGDAWRAVEAEPALSDAQQAVLGEALPKPVTQELVWLSGAPKSGVHRLRLQAFGPHNTLLAEATHEFPA